jgi:saccharopine dehydrogenase-like NADP-dependent oxidoreductase
VRLVRQIVDRRDLTTGLTAMSRTVGFTAAIGARLIAAGWIDQRGLLSPARDVPYQTMIGQLERHGIVVQELSSR